MQPWMTQSNGTLSYVTMALRVMWYESNGSAPPQPIPQPPGNDESIHMVKSAGKVLAVLCEGLHWAYTDYEAARSVPITAQRRGGFACTRPGRGYSRRCAFEYWPCSCREYSCMCHGYCHRCRAPLSTAAGAAATVAGAPLNTGPSG